MTVKEIVEKYLQENGYQGLGNAVDECACDLLGLGSECKGFRQDCEPGYINPCRCGGHDSHLGPEKEDLCDDCVKDPEGCDGDPTMAYDEGGNRDDQRVIRCVGFDEG